MNDRRVRKALLALLLLGCTTGCRRPSPEPPDASAELPKIAATLLARKGKVELSRGGGGWSDARVGDRLVPSDALRTGDGEAEIGLGAIRMRLHQSSALHLQRTSATSLRAGVRGTVESDVEPGRGALDVEMEGTDAVARSTGGHFFVTAEGRAIVAVATVTGSVNLAAKGREVEVKEGEVSRVYEGVPGAPSPALRRVLLSVRWPRALATSDEAISISGKVDPSSRVFVQGEPVAVEENGAFAARVPLHPGSQKVSVLVVDALGRRKQSWATILREEPPSGRRGRAVATAKKKQEWQWR
jgi:hypothetical protein